MASIRIELSSDDVHRILLEHCRSMCNRERSRKVGEQLDWTDDKGIVYISAPYVTLAADDQTVNWAELIDDNGKHF